MSDNVIDFKKHQHLARHSKKEAGLKELQQRFETALPSEKSPSEKLLNIFKKKKNTRTPKK
ncbi:MAG: hypothetical protein HRU05_09310 [Oceanospirillaceae bacterium]|nr:hypothetical protein [Oceanospirillaceae bacterium]